MDTRRKRRHSSTVVSSDQPEGFDVATIDAEPAQEVPPVVGSTSVEESDTEDGLDNADAVISLLQVATNDPLVPNLFSITTLTYGALIMQRTENACAMYMRMAIAPTAQRGKIT